MSSTDVLYMVQSPHQLLTAAIAAANEPDTVVLVHLPTHVSQDRYLELQSFSALPFADVQRLGVASKATNGLRRWSTALVNERRIERLVRGRRPSRVRVSNAQLLEGRALLAIGRREGLICQLAEDGLRTYEIRPSADNTTPCTQVSAVQRAVAPMSTESPLGMMPLHLIDELHVTHPDGIDRAAWPDVEITRAVDPRPLPPSVAAWMADVVERAAPDLPSAIDSMVFLPHFDLLSRPEGRTVRGAVEAIVEDRLARGIRVVVKYHPRDGSRYLGPDVPMIDVPIAGEFLLHRYGSSLHDIVTGRTTLLASASVFAPHAAVTVLESRDEARDIHPLLAAIDVTCLDE